MSTFTWVIIVIIGFIVFATVILSFVGNRHRRSDDELEFIADELNRIGARIQSKAARTRMATLRKMILSKDSESYRKYKNTINAFRRKYDNDK